MAGLGGRVTMGLSPDDTTAFVEGDAVVAGSVLDVAVDEGGGCGTFDAVGRFGVNSVVIVSLSSPQSGASMHENPWLQKKLSPSWMNVL